MRFSFPIFTQTNSSLLNCHRENARRCRCVVRSHRSSSLNSGAGDAADCARSRRRLRAFAAEVAVPLSISLYSANRLTRTLARRSCKLRQTATGESSPLRAAAFQTTISRLFVRSLCRFNHGTQTAVELAILKRLSNEIVFLLGALIAEIALTSVCVHR